MAAPFRIEHPSKRKRNLELNGQEDPNAGFKEYLSRLLLMIPGEIVGLYMIGSGFIPENIPLASLIWSVICLVLLIIVRLWGTADPQQGKPAQPVPVFISAIAFVIWLYWLGGPFAAYGLQVAYIGSLLVLVWSFIIPVFYKGD